MVIWVVSFRKTFLWIALLYSLCVISCKILFSTRFSVERHSKLTKIVICHRFYISLCFPVLFGPFSTTTLFSVLFIAIQVYIFRYHNFFIMSLQCTIHKTLNKLLPLHGVTISLSVKWGPCFWFSSLSWCEHCLINAIKVLQKAECLVHFSNFTRSIFIVSIKATWLAFSGASAASPRMHVYVCPISLSSFPSN